MTITEKIKTYLKENGISQSSIAKKIGLTPSKLSLSLSGRRALTLQEFEGICRVLRIPPNKFAGGEKEWEKIS